jgi:hypothetical protein
MKTKQSMLVSECGGIKNGSLPRPANYLAKLLKSTLTVALVFSAIIGGAAPFGVGDTKQQTLNKKTGPTSLTGRVVFVDKALRALAVDVKGQILQVNVPAHLRINRAGKLIALEEVVAGQEVTLTFRETIQGRLEVVLVTVEAGAGPAEAAGSKSNRGVTPPGLNNFPDYGSPNPANLGGQVRSPHR